MSSKQPLNPYLLAAAGVAGAAALYYALSAPKRAAPTVVSTPGVIAPLSEEEVVLKSRIKQHYDGCSPHYQTLWGKHIHHGLWREGQEHLSKEVAAELLVDEMLAKARLPKGAKVLDVGCGVGGTSCKLAALGHSVTGVSLSTTQVAMAKENMAKEGVTVRFLEMDGEKLSFPGEDGTFDAVWISEALSHFPRKDAFFAHAVRLLKPGGKIVIVDWFRGDAIGPKLLNGIVAVRGSAAPRRVRRRRRALTPPNRPAFFPPCLQDIEKGMLLPPMQTVTGYCNLIVAAGARPVYMDDVSKECAKTWDLCLDMVSPSLISLAVSMGPDFVAFVQAFRSMKDGFSSGSFRFTILVAEKPTVEQTL
jgi:tocopherol O-methyltransferase